MTDEQSDSGRGPGGGRAWLVLIALLIVQAFVAVSGIVWGLPSPATGAFLFPAGTEEWAGKTIASLIGPGSNSGSPEGSSSRGGEGDSPVILNDTPQKQAEIIRRYRLYSHQPDEMLTFISLAQMRGGLDPRMYQYGGLWFYPVGALLKVAGVLGWIKLTPDMAFYMDHPDEFGKFYIVARAYSAAWALVGVGVVFALGRRLFANIPLAAACAACFIFMPVVINASHEAKPHLAGAVLTLTAILFAMKYVESGRRRYWVLTGCICGMSAGMVLSGVVSWGVLAVVAVIRERGWRARVRSTLVGVAIAAGVYCVTNPYVPINLARQPKVVVDNLRALGNAKAISGRSNENGTLTSTVLLIAEGVSWPGEIAGVVAMVWLIRRRPIPGAWLMIVPAAAALLQFAWLAGGKPGEFGRFALLPDVALIFAAVGGIATIPRLRNAAAGVLVAGVACFGCVYLANFVADAKIGGGTRLNAARFLYELNLAGKTVAVFAEPAPYSMPPIEFRSSAVYLLRSGHIEKINGGYPDVVVMTHDDEAAPDLAGYEKRQFRSLGVSKISWANKPVTVYWRKSQ